MNWSTDRSIRLSRVGLGVFALLLLSLDLGCYWLVGWFIRLRGMHWQSGVGMMVTLYAASIFGWLLLWKLWRLLGNLRAERVFTEENVALLRSVSWCCVGAALLFLVGCLAYLPFLFVSLAAGFMGLIVRIVKNVFQQALTMKSELDLTI